MTRPLIKGDNLIDQSQNVFPVSLTQEGLWFLDQLEPQSAAYNVPLVLRIRNELDQEALARGLNTLVQRHAALRTTVTMGKEEPVQVVAATLTIDLPVVDLQGLPESARELEAERLATEEARRPFELAQGPLLRAMLVQLAPEEFLLVLTLHHIIVDEWSLPVLLRDLSSMYGAFTSGQPLSLPDIPFEYADFVAWQREMLEGDGLVGQLAYWERQLANRPEALELPTDRPRSSQPSSQGATYILTLSSTLTEKLEQLSEQYNATLYMTLVAAFQTLLYRYTGQEDVLIGTLAANRTRDESEAMIGFFANTLVLRTDLSDTLAFESLLARVREVVLEAHEHQELPFTSLVKAVHPERQVGRNPLFQVMLSMEPAISGLPDGWELTQPGNQATTSEFELSLKLQERAEGLACRFEYRTELFDEATIARLAAHWQTLLAGIVANPGSSLATLPLLSEEERQQILFEWNDTWKEYPPGNCAHELFEAQVERAPEAVAAVLAGKQLTYGELNQRANQLAHYLRELGVGPETMVGISMERSLEMVVGLIAILKAGGTNVPIDPTFPVERIAFMVEDTRMPLLLTQQKLLARFPASGPRIVCLDTDWQTISQQPAANPEHVSEGKHVAFVIYTSGSTGQPKGVLLGHYEITAHCRNMIEAYALRADDCCLQFSPFTFDASIEQTFPPLLVGARLLLRGPEVWTPTEFLDQIKEHQISVLSLPSAYWHQAISEWAADVGQLLDHPVRLVIVGGDRLPPETVQLWRQTPLCSARLLNVYGPTEGTIIATYFDVPRDVERDAEREQVGESISIGRPLPNRAIYILDKTGGPVPVGIPGLLHIGGDLIARGYLNRPELTAERFIADPFGQQPNARLYNTGDLARYLPGGIIDFLGRGDLQIKIRGFRIEPGEVEATISQHPAIRQVVVVAREDTPGDKRLVAYVVPQDAQEVAPLVAQLRALLKERLPDYMIPAAFVSLEELPLTPNGKLDRRALPAPEMTKRVEEATYVAPTLPVHHQLVQIWESLLDVRPIGIKDNFFELGGHSLLAALMFDRVAQVCGKKLPLSLFFTDATIEHLTAALLDDGKASSEGESRARLVPLQVGGSKRPFFYLHGDYLYGAFYCATLAPMLGADQPFYVLEPYNYEGLSITPSLEKAAAVYIESMRTVQPEGPYRLGGWCSGGLMAYEIARQLRVEGQRVELLVLMDPATAPERDRFMLRLFERISKLLHLGREEQLNWFIRSMHTMRYLRRARFRRARNAGPGSFYGPFNSNKLPRDAGFRFSKLFPSTEMLRRDNELIFEWMATGYTPYEYEYDEKITYFWTEEEPERRAAWEGGVKTEEDEHHTIPGNHLTSRTNYLDVLAERLRKSLNSLQD